MLEASHWQIKLASTWPAQSLMKEFALLVSPLISNSKMESVSAQESDAHNTTISIFHVINANPDIN